METRLKTRLEAMKLQQGLYALSRREEQTLNSNVSRFSAVSQSSLPLEQLFNLCDNEEIFRQNVVSLLEVIMLWLSESDCGLEAGSRSGTHLGGVVGSRV
ncbi:hypothetical protein Tco_1514563 [Tanacetum coccineum]